MFYFSKSSLRLVCLLRYFLAFCSTFFLRIMLCLVRFTAFESTQTNRIGKVCQILTCSTVDDSTFSKDHFCYLFINHWFQGSVLVQHSVIDFLQTLIKDSDRTCSDCSEFRCLHTVQNWESKQTRVCFRSFNLSNPLPHTRLSVQPKNKRKSIASIYGSVY